MRKAVSFLLLASLFITSGFSEMNSSGTSPSAQDSSNCVCKISELEWSVAYITKLHCQPNDCSDYEGIHTYEEGGPEYAWNLPGTIEAQSPLRIYLFDVTNRSNTIANYTVSLKNVGEFDLKRVSLVVSLPKGLSISSSIQPFLQSEDKSKVTWIPFTLKSTEAIDILFATNMPDGEVFTNLTAEASGVGEDDRLYKSKWDAGVYEVKDEAQWIVSKAGYKVITGE